MDNKMSQFEKFLRKKLVLTRFKKNLRNERPDLTFRQLAGMAHPERFVRGAFHWGATPEHHAFWSKIDNKWKELLNENL